jgi:CRP/FNR family transcriptional regulator
VAQVADVIRFTPSGFVLCDLRLATAPAVPPEQPVPGASNCASCSGIEHCLPRGLAAFDVARIERLIAGSVVLHKRDRLYGAGDRFHALYAIKRGCLKTTALIDDGREQVMSFHLPGEIIGFDGMDTDWHVTNATALDEAELCVIPFDKLDALARTIPTLQHNLHRIASMTIVRNKRTICTLGTPHSDRRLAMFLLNLVDRFRLHGGCASECVLCMTREEIGSFLGLSLGTVCRTLKRLHQEGVIRMERRTLTLADPSRLKRIANPPTAVVRYRVRGPDAAGGGTHPWSARTTPAL